MTEEKIIRIRCQGAALASYKDLVPFQGELKTLDDENYKKLKQSILDEGYIDPISVWLDADKRLCILDGHQRLKTITKMVEVEGYACGELPIDLVEADSFEQASEIVLALTSQYGDMTADSVHKYVMARQLNPQKVLTQFRFPQVKAPLLANKFSTQETKEDENDAPAAPEIPVTKTGDLWLLGAYFECEKCKKVYSYDEGKELKECPCV